MIQDQFLTLYREKIPLDRNFNFNHHIDIIRLNFLKSSKAFRTNHSPTIMTMQLTVYKTSHSILHGICSSTLFDLSYQHSEASRYPLPSA